MPGDHRPTVLIVEDDDVVSMILADVLDEAGYSVIGTVETACGTLAYLDGPPPTFAVVDVDLHRNPIGLVIGRDLMARGTIVLFATGFMVAYAEQMVEAGATACLTKPYLPDDVPRALDALAATRRGDMPQPVTGLFQLVR